jgi:hypothetical protein
MSQIERVHIECFEAIEKLIAEANEKLLQMSSDKAILQVMFDMRLATADPIHVSSPTMLLLGVRQNLEQSAIDLLVAAKHCEPETSLGFPFHGLDMVNSVFEPKDNNHLDGLNLN